MIVAFIMVLFMGVAVLDVLLAFACLKEESLIGKALARCLICASAITVFYLASILTDSYFVVSLTSSIYFCAIDIMLLFLLRFFYCLIDLKGDVATRINKVQTFLWVLVALDCVSLLLNPFTDATISYRYLSTLAVARFVFEPHLLYTLHLALCYCMIAFGFILVLYKAAHVPRLYRSRYLRVIGCVLAVVLLNALYLFNFLAYNVDISVITYSILGAGIYVAVLVWGNTGVMNQVRQTIVEHSVQPLLVFDFEEKLLYANDAAQDLFSLDETALAKLEIKDYIERLGVSDVLANNVEKSRFYWTSQSDEPVSYICDFQAFKDQDDAVVALAFSFTNNTLGIDSLTGFQTEQYFSLHNADISQAENAPIGVAICDLNQLSLLNNVLGYVYGDRAIVFQANLLRKYLPQRSVFVRMRDAKLGAVCYGLTREEIKSRLTKVNEALGQNNDFTVHLKMDFAICMLNEAEATVSDALDHAISILKTRKLLDEESNHSGAIDSLSQMLMECDPETESHVRRTRILGDSLAYAIGLSDYERDQLSLLCLFHDIGKVGIPPQILDKPSALTEAEWEIMREHVQKGYRIARATAGLEIVAEPILHHHENWDGSGYPDGLQAEAIPILSRIIGVIDAYDAMVSDRPYRKGISSEEACAELVRCAGTQFDPYIVDSFVRMIQKQEGVQSAEGEEPASEASRRDAGMRPVLDPGLHVSLAPAKAAMVNPVLYTSYQLDESYRIISADETFERLTGYTAYDIEHLSLTQNDLLFEEDRALYWSIVRDLLEQNSILYLEHRIRCKDGTGRYIYGMGIVEHHDDKRIITVIVTDITDSVSIQHQVGLARNRAMMSLRRLEETVRLDPLTGLLNKSAFKKACERELLDADKTCVMMMIDLDDFKHFNDTMGHPKGDELLAAFAKGFTDAVGPDGFVGRVGGDEFCCLLTFSKDVSLDAMAQRATQVWQKAGSYLDSLAYMTTLSSGAACTGLVANDYAALYHLADKALYEAKRSGKNQIYISW